MSRLYWPLFLVYLLLTSSIQAESYPVNFVVVDGAGKPVEKAELSTRWIVGVGKFEAVFDSKATTDAEGKATIEFQDFAAEHVLLGYSEDRSLGGFTVVERQDEDSTIEVKFAPTSEVSGNYICSETGSIPKWTNMIVSIEEVRGYFFEFRAKDGKVSFQLPQGTWQLKIYGSGIIDKKMELKISSEPNDGELGELDFAAEPIAKLKGKPAPRIEIAEARGLSKDFQLADLKGKWVLIEFWGYW